MHAVSFQVGEDCLKCGLVMLCPIANLYFRTKIRGQIREANGIEGSCAKDLLTAWCCPICALTQEARQVDADLPGLPEIARS